MEGKKINLKRAFGSYDFSMLFVVVFLCVFGLIMVYSSSYYTAELKYQDPSYFFDRQLKFDIFGMALIAILAFIPYEWLPFFTYPAYALSVVCMILTDFTKLGKNVNGQTRWLQITRSFSFQPSEMVKVAVIMMTALYISRHFRTLDRWKSIITVFLITAVPGLLVLKNNLSSGIVIFAIPIIMMLIATKKPKRLLILCGIALVVAVLGVFFGNWFVEAGLLEPYQLNRINVWKDPYAYAQEGGYQVLQGLYAIGSGGLFGKGLGGSTQKLGFVPEASNDMIFAILCEELGLFGAVCLIALFVFLLYRMYRAASKAPDHYSSMLVTGVMAHVALQVILHIAVVSNVIPNTGMTLPFISYGGTSSVFLMIEIGVVLGISRFAGREERP